MELPLLKYKHANDLDLVQYRINGEVADNGWFHVTSNRGGNLAFQIDKSSGQIQLSKTERDFGEYSFNCAAQFSDELWTRDQKVRLKVPPVFDDICLNPYKTNRLTLQEFHSMQITPTPGWCIKDKAGNKLTSFNPLVIEASKNFNSVLLLTFRNTSISIRMQLKYKANSRLLMALVNTCLLYTSDAADDLL